MIKTFKTKQPINPNLKKVNAKKYRTLSKKRLIQFHNIFYQTLCQYNPNIIAMENDEFLEYLADQIWEEGILQRKLKNDGSNDPTASDSNELFGLLLSDQEIVDKIFEIINQDFINFEICNNENEILEISKSILQNYKSTISPPVVINKINKNGNEDDDNENDEEEEREQEGNNKEEEEEEYEPDTCQLCHRYVRLSFHHLIPKMVHKRVISKGMFSKEECQTRGINICRPCHSACHKMISHKDLAYYYNTLDKLLQHDGIARFVEWNSKQKSRSK